MTINLMVRETTMSEEKPSQSFSISGGQLSNLQLGGQAGQDMNVTQNQRIGSSEFEKPPSQEDVIKLFSQLEELFRNSELPETQKVKAIKHLEAAKEEAQAEEPDKDFAAKNLQRATKVLKEVGETVEVGTGLWKKTQPIINSLLPWLGVAANFFA